MLLNLISVAAAAFAPASTGIGLRSAVQPPREHVRMFQDGHCKVVFLRHGQSIWNEANLFTGWADVPLTTLGKNEAATGATQLWREGIEFDVCVSRHRVLGPFSPSHAIARHSILVPS